MSIYFNFEVGPTGRRFRRAVDGDKPDIEYIIKNTYGEIYGGADIGTLIQTWISGDRKARVILWPRRVTVICEKLIGEKLLYERQIPWSLEFSLIPVRLYYELSTLSICMIDANKDVTGFIALGDHPNVPGISQVDWEIWMRNMFQKFYLARNTLFVHFLCCLDDVADIFLEEALTSVFSEDVYLNNIVLMIPHGCPEEYMSRYLASKRRNVYKYFPSKLGSGFREGNCCYFYTAMRQDFCPKLKIRGAVEEDNDDIVEILDKKCPKLKELYGEYYISEIIGRHPTMKRKVIVADYQDHVNAIMCLNSEVNYENLQNTYELHSYYGLRKATPLEKELKKRSNVLLKAFGEPILYGKWGPFDRTSKAKQKIDEDVTPGETATEPRIKTSSKVIFRHISLTEDRYDRVYMKKDVSDDYSVKFGGTSPTVSLISNASVAELLDEDPFDYEIVNIDTKLLKVPRVISYDYEPKSQGIGLSTITEFETKCKKRTSVSIAKKQEDINKINYSGDPNAFIIELFGCREDVDYKQSFDFLEAAFEAMKDYDYCIIRVPCTERSFPLLQHFCCIPAKPGVCSKYALYLAHRNSILGKLRVRKAELIDVPLIAQLLNTLDVKETMWTVENTVHKRNESIFVLLCGCSLVGLGILEKAEQIDYLQNRYNFDSYRIQKYHYKWNGVFAGFSALKTVLIYPVFEAHFRFFAREMMRLSECTTLIWMTAYRNKWVAHKANTLAIAMIPLVPRESEVDCVSIPEIKKINTISNSLEAFSTWFISKKFTTVPKVNVDTRIVVVGASRTTMSFLNALLFSDSCTYLTFTNVTLISPSGLPYVRHSKALVENMFLKCRTNTDRYLKSVPYSYYVNIIQGTLTEIHRREKYVKLANGTKYCYDLLFLLFGKQYQHPNYMKTILDKEDKMKKGLVPIYTPLDLPICAREKYFSKRLPENVFIINNLSDANKALNYIKNNLMYFEPYCVIVYGATIHAYCCLSTMLQMGVPNQNIVFVEPFPSEDPRKPRISVFANVYVDRTVNDMLKNLNIKTYSSYYFDSWSCDFEHAVASVTFMSQFKMIQLPCSAFFYYGKQGVDEDAFVAINKSGIAYNEGILIDHEFRTRDLSIYAAGPATRYNSNYYADDKQQRYYDSYEVGTKLGTQIRNQLDPLYVDTDKYVKRSDNNIDDSGSTFSSSYKESSSVSSNEFESKMKVPDFKEPRVMYCSLPGGLQYLEVRSPGKKIPCHYIQSLHYNGHVIETFKEGYFKLHFNNDFVVDGITCLTPDKRPLENFVRLYGRSSVVLNNVFLRYTAKKFDNLYAFFRSPWAFFLYHDKSEELFAIVKELLPKGHRKGKTLKEALYSAAERLSSTSCTESLKSEMRSVFESSPHVEAIIDYVMEWLSEHEALLPVYLQPWHQAEFAHDEQTNPAFKRKRSIIKMLKAIY